MKKIQTVVLPTEALNGLIHGYHHHSKDADVHSKSLFYIDVTDRSAYDALYSILKRETLKGIVPMGYDSSRGAAGFTSPPSLAVVLSNNLLHIDDWKMAKGLQAIFGALARTTYTNDTQITVYGEPGVEKIINTMRHESYKDFREATHPEITMGDFDLESNITIDQFVHMAIEPEFIDHIRNSPGSEFKLGSNFIFMHYDDLAKVVVMIRKCGKVCIMHPDLHRYYFENVICKY